MAMQAKRSDKAAQREIKKVKAAIKKGDRDRTAIYAQNAIRYKNEGLQYVKLSARVDAVASQVQMASRVKQVTRAMYSITELMRRAMESMNLETISNIMDEFEAQFENMDVQTATVEETMQRSAATSTPQDQVNALISLVAEENGLELGEELSSIVPGHGNKEADVMASNPTQEEVRDDLKDRLTRLKS